MNSKQLRISLPEFVALIGMMSATVAFSVDSMLPALGVMAQTLSPDDPNRVQWVILSFTLGLGIGTLFMGPLSDAIGRKPIVLGGAAVYCAASIWAWASQSLEGLLLARLVQGLGVSGPRIAAIAIVRDLYAGRQMARVVSFAMMVFVLVPAVAPLIGSWIMDLAGWRAIFFAFLLFAMIISLWTGLRLPETLAPDHQRPFRLGKLRQGAREMFAIRKVALATAALSLAFSVIFLAIIMSQPVFEHTFDRAESFPEWFAFLSLLSIGGGLANARLVVIFGMRRVIATTFVIQFLFSVLVASASWGWISGEAHFVLYLAWLLSLMMTAALTIGNLNAMGLEPLGHLAGLASSIMSSIATVAAAVISALGGYFFTGTPLVQALAVAFCAGFAALFTLMVEPDTAP